MKKWLWVFDSPADALHYGIILAVLAVAWVPMMNYFQNSLVYTLIGAYALLVAADKIAHKLLGVD